MEDVVWDDLLYQDMHKIIIIIVMMIIIIIMMKVLFLKFFLDALRIRDIPFFFFFEIWFVICTLNRIFKLTFLSCSYLQRFPDLYSLALITIVAALPSGSDSVGALESSSIDRSIQNFWMPKILRR